MGGSTRIAPLRRVDDAPDLLPYLLPFGIRYRLKEHAAIDHLYLQVVACRDLEPLADLGRQRDLGGAADFLPFLKILRVPIAPGGCMQAPLRRTRR
jgi:hypothetical protein